MTQRARGSGARGRREAQYNPAEVRG